MSQYFIWPGPQPELIGGDSKVRARTQKLISQEKFFITPHICIPYSENTGGCLYLDFLCAAMSYRAVNYPPLSTTSGLRTGYYTPSPHRPSLEANRFVHRLYQSTTTHFTPFTTNCLHSKIHANKSTFCRVFVNI